MNEVEVWDGGLVVEAGRVTCASCGLVFFAEGTCGELSAGGVDD